MGLNFQQTAGQTPLEEEEKEGLRIPTVATRAELDEFEQQNIEDAIQWAMQRTFKPETILTEAFVMQVHKRMYADVWAWAGEFRKSNKNLGVDKWQIPIALRYLLDDTTLWIANKTYAADEVTLRFKHRLVSIHCFANGNGRHSRLMADIISESIFKQPIFTWGAGQSLSSSDARTRYLAALRAADAGEIAPLLAFARS